MNHQQLGRQGQLKATAVSRLPPRTGKLYERCNRCRKMLILVVDGTCLTCLRTNAPYIPNKTTTSRA